MIVGCLLWRLECPVHGGLVQAVPFARPRARFTLTGAPVQTPTAVFIARPSGVGKTTTQAL